MKKKIRVVAEFEFETETDTNDDDTLDEIVVDYMNENNFPIDEFDEWYISDIEEIQ